jgi:hypothetical protein
VPEQLAVELAGGGLGDRIGGYVANGGHAAVALLGNC